MKLRKRNYFFVNGVRTWTYLNKLTAGDIKELGEGHPNYFLTEETDDDAHPWKQYCDSEAIDLTGKTRHFFTPPPATYR